MFRLVAALMVCCSVGIWMAGCAAPGPKSQETAEATPAQPPTPPTPPAPPAPPRPATPAAQGSLTKAIPFTTTSMSGAKIDFPKAYPGKLVLVTFWATWCPHCRQELPYWRDAYTKYHDQGLVMIGLPTDKNRGTTADKVADFVKVNKMDWEQVYDDAPQLSAKYKARAVPWSFLIDADTGQVLAQKGEIRREDLGKVIEEQLAIKKGTAKPAKP
jgi:thiol-disulfide isomerase/thioredoxin